MSLQGKKMNLRWSVALAGSLLALGCGSGTGGTHVGGSGFDAGDGSLSNPDAHSLGSKDGGKKDGGGIVLGTPDAGNDGACATKVTCASAKAGCGTINDGCGGVTQCGGCPSGSSCGAAKANQCGSSCTPTTCAALGATCGSQGDGCGKSLDCGSCGDAGTCGGGGTPNQCGSAGPCVPTTCATLGFDCGTQGDGCGGTLDCGTCASGQSCGGGGTASVCGAPVCVPKTCAGIGAAACGPAADGCGGLLNCGACSLPDTCGGVTSGQCGIPTTCTGLCLKQTSCAGTATTSISGTVYAPNGTDPIYNALVYVPNSAVQAFVDGVATPQCDCSAEVTGSPLVSAVTGVDGTFTITNMPVGANIPLVIQNGRWRRQVTIPSVASCVNTAVAAKLTNFPVCRTGNASAKCTGLSTGDIPLMAFATGSVDALECVVRKIGVSDTEFTNGGGAGRVQFYKGSGSAGAHINGTTPSETTLLTSQAAINAYDMVLFPCQGSQYKQSTTDQTYVTNFANAGGRVFTTHFSYVWLFNDSPFSTTASWAVDPNDNNTFGSDPQTGYINQTFPRGLALAQWLKGIGASTTLGQISVNTLRDDFTSVVAPSLLWLNVNDSSLGDVPMHYTFDTPVGTPAAQQCGRVLFDDFHVENVSGAGSDTFPAECTGTTMTPQEKMLEFMLFDLGACVAPPTPSCTPTTCASQGIGCGPAGDGCGNTIQCGNCPAGDICSGTPSTCSAPTCTAETCAAQGIQCGPAGDGCGNTIQCGTCPAGETCGGGGKPGICGAGTCTPETCASQGIQCGPAGDGCGNSLACGTCPAGETCGGGGEPGVCGNSCMAQTCASLGFSCGAAADGCGGQLNCGTCSSPNTCGGGGQANVCGGGIPK
jgi:hypothetical protein